MITIPQSDLVMQFAVLFLQEPTIGLFDQMKLIKQVQGVLQWNWSMQCFHNINNTVFGSADPVRKIHVIGHSGTQHDNAYMFW